ncbi:60S ribosomal protein L17 [Cichlidogyrus casuarinus]|uniref:Large ribosomal subunit protein uL22 n=1 Tax=Cichlidogyrus casuarinus TaxID=1844966 RepID=A0ABD2Q1J0_9PLAT
MTRYSWEPKEEDEARHCKARGVQWRVHMKNTHECSRPLLGMTLQRAQAYLKNVIEKKEIVPFRKYNGGVSRHAQAKHWGTDQGRWPQKSAKMLLQLLHNAYSNAHTNNIKADPSNLIIKHIQVNDAPSIRRRTFRAHGRLNPYMCNPCHVEVVLGVAEATVPIVGKEKSKKELKRRA